MSRPHDAADRHRREFALFQRALELPIAERAAFLARETGDDRSLARSVLALLDADRTGSLGEGLALAPEAPRDAELAEEELLPAGTEVGPFRILRLLGRGGMGVVYAAEQVQPARTVALKMARAGLSSRSALRRFENESAILARLHHPSIAQVYAAGQAELRGRTIAWFAMELVEGAPITEHADRAGLDVNSRLSLLAAVGDAVHHAHETGVLHRDLKPANLLVGADGIPKVLDFGIARALHDEARETAHHTLTGQILGTLAYLSPEQASGEREALSVATDVHALGVIGFELLTGELPYPLRSASLTQALQLLSQQEPRSLRKLRPELAPDLEVIFAKALERDPARRYATARAFAEDLRAFLAHRPIAARPPSSLYLARKFVRRHRGFSVGIALAVLATLGGTAISVAWALHAEEERGRAVLAEQSAKQEAQRAEQESSRARAAEQRALEEVRIASSITAFVNELFESAKPEVALGIDVSARSLLERGQAQLLASTEGEPVVRARLLLFVGEVLTNLARYAESERLLREAVAIMEKLFPESDFQHIDALQVLGTNLYESSRIEEAKAIFERAQQILQAVPQPRLLQRARGLEALGHIAWKSGELELARERFTELLRLREALAERRKIAKAHQGLAVTLQGLGELPAAQAHYESALAALASGEDADLMMELATNLGSLRMAQGQAAEGEELFRLALGAGEKVYPPEHPILMRRLCNLGGALAMTGRLEEALPLLERAHAIGVKRATDQDESFANVCGMLANSYAMQQDYERAVPLWERALAIQENLVGKESPRLRRSLQNLLLGYEALERTADAAALKQRLEALPKGPR
ncbi:MAG: serine/threonine protein kinase [Planctomycetes bacterium]|nr:serine/threonine protein kinase [Planctomycetota bacterium]